MKIRIKSNSLRYRLTKSDVDRLYKEGYLEETTDFGTQQLTYSIKRHAFPDLTASFENNAITLYMPSGMVNELANTEKVGFAATYGTLYLLVEKDFVCLDAVAEDQSDNYPNPLLS